MERVDGKAEDDGWCVLMRLLRVSETHPVFSMLGELTNVGRQSAYQYGKALRALYITKWVAHNGTIDPNLAHTSQDCASFPIYLIPQAPSIFGRQMCLEL